MQLAAGHRAATRLERHLRAALGTPRIPEPAAGADELRRRRIAVSVVTVVGAAVLGWSLNVEPGSGWFYAAALILAAVWTAGAFVSGPLHLGRVGRVPDARRSMPTTVPSRRAAKPSIRLPDAIDARA